MLENRSFDHMLGFSGLSGTDAATGQPTKINGLDGTENNVFDGKEYPVIQGADFRMDFDPGHEFTDVVQQLCGPNAKYPLGGPYPAIDNSGFVASYVAIGGTANPGEIMKCYAPAQLPVLNALACDFVVCDNWYSSVPGPTWPNRMFVHAASSSGLDHSPSTDEILQWETLAGFQFKNGNIFDALNNAGIKRRLYGGDDFPMVSALKGIHFGDIRHFTLFASDLHRSSFDSSYVFIEPSYDILHDYRAGTSQHPLGDVTQGEALIKVTYESIRNSPVWESSLLIITWDEHGGFFDHVAPPPAPPPGDTRLDSPNNRNGFAFDRYGPRVPAIVVSPLIPRGLIDHRVYDHASIPATIESIFGLKPLTARDAQANRLDALVTLDAPRQDARETLPAPAVNAAPADRPNDSVNDGNLPGLLHAALQQDLALSPGRRVEILARVAAIKVRDEAMLYLAEVQHKLRQHLDATRTRG